MCVGDGGLAGCSGRRILLNCPGVISGRGCVTRETAGTLWKSNAYISHFERRRASFCFHPFFYYRTRALSPFLVLFTFRVSRALPGYRTASLLRNVLPSSDGGGVCMGGGFTTPQLIHCFIHVFLYALRPVIPLKTLYNR